MNFMPGAMELAAEGTGVELAAELDTATTAMESKRIDPPHPSCAIEPKEVDEHTIHLLLHLKVEA